MSFSIGSSIIEVRRLNVEKPQHFFRGPHGIEDCLATMTEALGIKFVGEKDGDITRHRTECLGLELILFHCHAYVNNLGIPFEDFPYEITLEVAVGEVGRETVEAFRFAAGRFLCELVTSKFGWHSMLVDDMQRVVADSPPGEVPG